MLDIMILVTVVASLGFFALGWTIGMLATESKIQKENRRKEEEERKTWQVLNYVKSLQGGTRWEE